METTQIKEAACGACAFWKKTGENAGECRVQPPQAIAFKVDEETRVETRFPVTEATDWCGEFKKA